MRFRNLLLFLLSPIFLSKSVLAHCPLCTIGAGAAAGAAVWLGVSKVAVVLFIGAFAMSMGMWFAKLVKKQYIPFQKTLIIASIFALTFFPLLPMFTALGPLYIPFLGEYGTTFLMDYSLYAGLLGGLMVLIAPSASRKITKMRNGKHIPFQMTLIIASIFALTFFPLLPMFTALGPLYIPFLGEYGTTFLMDYSLYAGLLGGLMVLIAPSASRKITKMRNGKHIPFQIMLLSFVALLIVGTGIQFLV